MAMFFSSAYHTRERGRLYGGAYITTLAEDLGLLPAGHPLISAEFPPSRIDMASVRSMRVTRVFEGQTRFSTPLGQIFEAEPLPDELPPLPQPLIEPVPDIEMPDQPGGQQQQQQHPHEQPPPQHPQHVYREVRLSRADRVEIDAISRRVGYLSDCVTWLMQREIERAAAEGRVLPPVPQPPPDQDAAADP